MIIKLSKFGKILLGRPEAVEAYASLLLSLDSLNPGEDIKIDFDKVLVFTPGWADEFIMSLYKKIFGRLSFINTKNSSVKATLEFLEKINNVKFNIAR